MAKSLNFPDIRDALARISRGERATTPSLNVPSLLQFWLWGSDANELCDRGKCDFHLMHLSGMVCTRVFSEAYHTVADRIQVVPSIIDDEDVIELTDRCDIFLPHFYGDNSKQPTSSLVAEKCLVANNNGTKSQLNKPIDNQTKSDQNESIPINTRPRTGGTTIVIKVPGSVTLQQLRDLVHAVQTQWPLMQKAIESSGTREQQLEVLQVVDRLVTQLFVWFGYYLFESNIQEWQADDKEFVDSVPPTHALALTEMGIKFYLNIFFVLFRLLFIQRHAIAVPVRSTNASTCYPFSIETFHVEAGVDDFHLLGMYFDIPAGCLLEYKHSYSGYYNNVSQCVYRHFPSYKRRIPVQLSDVLCDDAPDLSVLPSLKQIYPEIEFAFEDHHFFRDVAGVRVAVLLSPSKLHSHDPNQGHLNPAHTKQSHPNLAATSKRVSEKLQAHLTICNDGVSCSGDNTVVEGARSMKTTDWFWFAIGANIYLINTKDGVAYSGSCRDLLTFYLSLLHKKQR
jgi:hypothetical protein